MEQTAAERVESIRKLVGSFEGEDYFDVKFLIARLDQMKEAYLESCDALSASMANLQDLNQNLHNSCADLQKKLKAAEKVSNEAKDREKSFKYLVYEVADLADKFPLLTIDQILKLKRTLMKWKKEYDQATQPR